MLHSLPQHLLHPFSRAALLLVFILTCYLPSAALAQEVGSYKDPAPAFPLPPTDRKIPPVQILRVDFGFDEALVPEKFIPITVWLASHNNSYSGVLILDFKQDGSQRTKYLLPVSTTPGKVVPFEFVAAFPDQTGEVTLTLQSSQIDAKVIFSNGGSNRAASLPAKRNFEPFILLIDLPPLTNNSLKPDTTTVPKPTSSTPDFTNWNPNASASQAPRTLWDNFTTAPIAIDRLPRSWIAYNNCTLIIVPASSLRLADPQAFDALLTWVRSGGRLLVVADTPGSDWTRVFPSDDPLPLQLGEIQDIKPLFAGTESRTDSATDTPQPLHLADVKKSRPIHLASHARASGWSGSWPISPSIPQSPPTQGADQSAWLSAMGPVGLGIVCILGTDPIYRSEEEDLKIIQQAYFTLVEPLIASHTRVELLKVNPNAWYMRYATSDPLGRRALDEAITHLANVPVFGIGAFISILVLMALLTLVIGLIAGLIRKKLTSSMQSWYFAGIAIFATSLLSYIAPIFMRSGESMISRVTLLDGVLDAEGTLQGGAVSEICGFFAGKPGTIKLIGDEPGAWWRGVSSVSFTSSNSSPLSDLNLPINYAAGTLANSVPADIDQGQWTYRITSRAAPFDPLISPIQVNAQYTSEYQIELTLNGLPPEATLKNVYAKLSDNRFVSLSLDQTAQVRITRGKAKLNLDTTFATVQTPTKETTDPFSNMNVSVNPLHVAQGFPIARDRTDALELKLKNSDSILLVITLEGSFTPFNMMPIEPSLDTQTIQIRVVAPLAPFSPHAATSSTPSK